jgi:quinol monooxygenase YgiN
VSIVAIADMFGLAGRRKQLADLLANAEREAAGIPGCRRYTFAVTLADADHFVLVSEWDDQASMDAHYTSKAFATFQFSLNGLLAKPSEMTTHSISSTARPVASTPIDPRDAD